MSTCELVSMAVEQAVFASADRGRVKGYQLVSKSPGVDRDISQALSRWAPTKMLSADPEHWTINYFPVSEDDLAITRTTIGGPEYSNRGANQIVTSILLLRNHQFEAYCSNAIAVAKTAMIMGQLRLPWDLTCEQLPLAELPTRPLLDAGSDVVGDRDRDAGNDLINELVRLVNASRRFAVLGASDPIGIISRVIPRLSEEIRREFSFTTGLGVSARRPFFAHFLPDADSRMLRTLDSQKIVPVPA